MPIPLSFGPGPQPAEHRFFPLMRHLQEAVLIADEALTVVAASRPAMVLFGLPMEALAGASLADLFHGACDWTAGIQSLKLEISSAVGLPRSVLVFSEVLTNEARKEIVIVLKEHLPQHNCAQTIRDLQEQVQHLQRQVVLAEVFSGYVHDINNKFTTIVSFASLLRENLKAQHENVETLNCILKSADHAHAITQRLLSITKRRPLTAAQEDVNQILNSMLPLARRILGHKINLVSQISQGPARVHVYPGQVEQVLWNLVLNAKEAMPQGGQVLLCSLSEDASDHRYCGFSIKDSGSGIPAELHDKIFAPFFTTKAQGSGLGLAVVEALVSGHGGRVKVIPDDMAGGACFHVLWPCFGSHKNKVKLSDHLKKVPQLLEQAQAQAQPTSET